jgi:hypothetical protein
VATVSCSFPTAASTPTIASSSGGGGGGLLAEALRGYPVYAKILPADAAAPPTPRSKESSGGGSDDLPLGATFETTAGLKAAAGSLSPSSNAEDGVNIELDNAGRVKSGKVRQGEIMICLASLKGTVSRDFSLLVFFINQFPPSPRVSH